MPVPLLHGNPRFFPIGRLCSPDDVPYYHCSVLSVIDKSVGVDAYVLSVLTDDVGLGFSDDVGIETSDNVDHWFSDIGRFPPPTVSAIRASKGTGCSCIKMALVKNDIICVDVKV
eukprot:Gb_15847 [translate_table: standard]